MPLVISLKKGPKQTVKDAYVKKQSIIYADGPDAFSSYVTTSTYNYVGTGYVYPYEVSGLTI